MQIHGTCVAREGAGVVLLGPSGAGKSDLALRLLERGFALVADDRVDLDAEGWASAPAALAGLIEVRGLGMMRVAALPRARLVLAVLLGVPDRLPVPRRYGALAVPEITLDPRAASAPQLVGWALDVIEGKRELAVGGLP